MIFTFLGSSAGLPTKQRNVSGLAIRMSNQKLWCLVDCGEGTQHQLLHAPYSLNALAAIFITHMHGDHTFGLPGLLASAAMAGRTEPLTIVGPEQLQSYVKQSLLLTDSHLSYPLIFKQSQSITESMMVAGMKVTPWPLSHRVPCHAWQFTEHALPHQLNQGKLEQEGIAKGPVWGQIQRQTGVIEYQGRQLLCEDYWLTSHQGHSIIVAGDNDQPELLAAAAANSQVLIHEATYSQEIADKVGPAPMHSSARQVATFAQQAGLAHLLLTHFSARYGGAGKMSVQQLAQEAQSVYQGQLALANDLDSYQLKSDGKLHYLPPEGAKS
ncbi:ribonuclease Z [Motilimonas pumila]|uniref:Ribonuclease Z n=1 Tax=Motilimonas pumila TaxID=2303987 RepID=A0A418YC47_9GAMM|nr:ribonuclease Z [Motilimonas pumila]RJG42095.1 MBL fold metallo-hydrolase [Motilimonas pumila]